MADVVNLNQFQKTRGATKRKSARRRHVVRPFRKSQRNGAENGDRSYFQTGWQEAETPPHADCSFRSWLQPHDLPRVHKVRGIDRLFQTAHYVYRRLAVFLD